MFRGRPNIIMNWMKVKGYSGTYYDAINGYFQSTSGLTKGTLMDHLVQTLVLAGTWAGNVDDSLTRFFQSQTGITGRGDAERAFWKNTALSFSGGTPAGGIVDDDGNVIKDDDGNVVIDGS